MLAMSNSAQRIMLVQRSAKDSNATAGLAWQMASSASHVQYGALVRLGRDDPAQLRTWLGSAKVTLLVADPEAWTRADQHSVKSLEVV